MMTDKGPVPRRERYVGAMRSLLVASRKMARPALTLFLILAVITGIAYPLLVTGVAQLAFPHQANGSQISVNGTVIGSDLIGQPFSDPKYFWGRPSATPGYPDNASLSSGTNYGPNNPALQQMEQARIDALHAADPNNTLPIPSDLVTASGSGLDPDISVASALYQLHRVALARNMSESAVQVLIDANTADRQFDILGEKTVNVLHLNLALDDLQAKQGRGVIQPIIRFAEHPFRRRPGPGADTHQLGIHLCLFCHTGGVVLLDQQADHQRL